MGDLEEIMIELEAVQYALLKSKKEERAISALALERVDYFAKEYLGDERKAYLSDIVISSSKAGVTICL